MDWNEDGLEDLIVGDRQGLVNYFQRLPGGDLVAMPPLAGPEGRIDAGTNSAPEVADWNGDGLPDLLLGRADPWPGSVVLFTNTGSPGQPTLSDSSYLTAGGEKISHVYSVPRVFDLDRDGKSDLLIGEASGHVYWFRNVGSPGQPALETGVRLECETGQVFNAAESRLWVGDYDSDGVPDLLTGDYSGMVHLYRGSDTTGVTSDPPTDLGLRPVSNPSAGAIELLATGAQGLQATVSLYAQDGRLLYSSELVLREFQQRIVLPRQLPSGCFLAIIRAGGSRVVCRVVSLAEGG